MAQNRHIPRYNKITKKLLLKKDWYMLLVGPKQANVDYFFKNWGTFWKFGPFQSPLSRSAIDDFLIFRRNFYKEDVFDIIPVNPTAVLSRARCAPGDACQSRAALLCNEAAPVGPAVLTQARCRRGDAPAPH